VSATNAASRRPTRVCGGDLGVHRFDQLTGVEYGSFIVTIVTLRRARGRRAPETGIGKGGREMVKLDGLWSIEFCVDGKDEWAHNSLGWGVAMITRSRLRGRKLGFLLDRRYRRAGR